MRQRESEIGHKKEVIEDLFAKTKGLKDFTEQIPSMVGRLEQKRKVHDMSAHILLTIEKIEKQ